MGNQNVQRKLPEAPECDKMLAVRDKSQVIGEFLDWLGEQGITLARYTEDTEVKMDRLVPVYTSIDKILAEYFDIDLDKVEQEKRTILKALRQDGKSRAHHYATRLR
jgi:hypothetical protein